MSDGEDLSDDEQDNSTVNFLRFKPLDVLKR
jgi:hypothetical protein